MIAPWRSSWTPDEVAGVVTTFLRCRSLRDCFFGTSRIARVISSVSDSADQAHKVAHMPVASQIIPVLSIPLRRPIALRGEHHEN